MMAIARPAWLAAADPPVFGDTVPGAQHFDRAAAEPALQDDAARMFERLGLSSCRAALIDMDQMVSLGAWGLSDQGSGDDLAVDSPLDIQFPGVGAALVELDDVTFDVTVVRRMSAQHWTFAWHLNRQQAVVALVHYPQDRAALRDIDTNLVRLMCNIGIGSSKLQFSSANDSVLPREQTQQSEPGARAPSAPSRVMPFAWPLAVVIAVCSAGLALWIALVALPAESARSARQQAMAEKTMLRMLSTAMAAGDLGEVQRSLATFGAIGYFDAAAVTNGSGHVVSLLNPEPGWRVGDAVPAGATQQARPLALIVGNKPHGYLWLFAGSSTGADTGSVPTGAAAVAAMAAALGAVALWLWQRRRPRPHSS